VSLNIRDCELSADTLVRQMTDQRQVAGRLLREQYFAMNANKTDFNRTIVYSNAGIV